MRPVLLSFILLSLAPFSHAGPPPAFPNDEAAAASLGASDFVLRENAARHLWRSGAPALPLLQKIAAGETESSLRARAIAENIRLCITPDTPGDLADLIRSIHAESNPEKGSTLLAEALRQKTGIRNVLALIGHHTDARPENWDQIVAASAVALAENAEPTDGTYQKLLTAVQGDALPAVFSAAAKAGNNEFAYDTLTFSENPSQRPAPVRRQRILEELAKPGFTPDQPPFERLTHHRRPLEARIARAENVFGDPAALPALLEKLLTSSPTASQNADALTAVLYEQDLLPAWIEKYQKLAAAQGAPTHIHLALAQFLRASGRHREAFEAADSTFSSFALLAGEWDQAESNTHNPHLLTFLARLTDPELPIKADAFPSKQYLKFVAETKLAPKLPDQFANAESLATVSPLLARKILDGTTFQTIERNRGSMGPYLRAKRILGEHAQTIDYISARFATMTSEFWDDFLEKYFGHETPLWVMLHIRARNPHLDRYSLFRQTLTEGTSALVEQDILNMFEEYRAATDHVVLPSRSLDRLALRIRSTLKHNRFPAALDAIRKWESTLPQDDYRRGLLDPEQLPADGFDYLRPGESWDVDPELDRKSVLTSLTPNPFALLRLAAHELGNNRPSEAVHLLALAKVITLDRAAWQHEFHDTLIGGKPVAAEIDKLLESALGLEDLKNGHLPAAEKRFENLNQLGSTDHRLGAALYGHHLASSDPSKAEALFESHWRHLESILQVAPRDAEVCRALASWSKSCGDRRQPEAKIYAELAATLTSEQAQLEAHLTRFHW